MNFRTTTNAQLLCDRLKKKRSPHPLSCALAILFFIVLDLGSAAFANEYTSYAREIEKDLATVLEGRLTKQQYLVTAEVTAVAASGEKSESSNVPFLPFKISKSILKSMLSGQEQGVDYLRMSFEVTLLVDVSVAEQTMSTIQSLLNKRYAIENANRRLTVSRSVLIVKEPLPVDAVANDNSALEKAKLESEKARAILESERVRLEMERAQMSGMIEREALMKKYSEEKGTNDKKLTDLEERIRILTNPVAEPKSLYKEFQWAIISGVVVIGVLVAFFIAGFFLRAGMSTLSDGVKSVGSGVGNAMLAGVNAKLDHERAVISAAKKERDASEKSGESLGADDATGEQHEDWVSGNQEFEVYVAKLQDKIEILSREKNFLFIRRFLDYGETDAKIGVAASILLALPRDTGKTILDEVPVVLVDKLQTFLATPYGLMRAKAIRKQAIQDFYGAIAMDEFSGSPLMALSNLGWLTRMSSLELAVMIGNMDTDLQPVLLSCLTQTRIMKIIESAPDAEVKNMIVLAIANTKNVDEKSIGPALKSIQQQFKSQDSGYRKPSLTNSVQILKSVIFDLEPAQQDKLIKDIGDDQDTLTELAKYYVPFRIIGSLGPEWVREIFSGFSNPEIAIALFNLNPNERSKVVGSLPNIQAESLTTELSMLDQDVKYLKRNRSSCHKLQKEISEKILALRNSGVLELSWPAESGGKKSSAGSSFIKGVA